MNQKTIKFNVNNYVHIKLTDAGRKELVRQHEELKKQFPKYKHPHMPPVEDTDGYSKWQLWDLMGCFGHMLQFPTSSNVPFETEIKFEI